VTSFKHDIWNAKCGATVYPYLLGASNWQEINPQRLLMGKAASTLVASSEDTGGLQKQQP